MAFFSRIHRINRSTPLAVLTCSLLLVGVLLTACSNGSSNQGSSGSGGNAATPTPVPQVALTQLKWCSTPSQVFRDQASPNPEGGTSSASTAQLGPADGKPKVISDWNTFKANMGFTVYLPKTLPSGSCLLSVSGSLRDPVFGSNFTITYVLPSQDALSFSQAPARSQTLTFQCNVSQNAAPTSSATNTPTTTTTPTTATTPTTTTTPTAASASVAKDPIQLCNGLRDKTNVVFSSRGQTASLQQFFQSLQPDQDWTPAN
ncbi:hypothetical protein ccbrp13_38370 [Ktedonobacteria bacterium brp13]|nr:hypothetical protein ccbrp13_38370 [Ktedonobacteria bacterium brp13]